MSVSNSEFGCYILSVKQRSDNFDYEFMRLSSKVTIQPFVPAWRQMVTRILVKIGSADGLLSDGTKLLPETICACN